MWEKWFVLEIIVEILSGTTWTFILRSNVYTIYLLWLLSLDVGFVYYVSNIVPTYFIFQTQQRSYFSEAVGGRSRYSDAATNDLGSVYSCEYDSWFY